MRLVVTRARVVAVVLSVASLGTAGLLPGAGQVASAAGPAGTTSTCPTGAATTLAEFLVLAAENEVPAENAERTFGRVNKNQDSWICVARVPGLTGFNFIDNQAVGLDR